MAEFETNENTTPEGNDVDYIAALAELKANSVPKSDYDKLKQENKRLIGEIITGTNNETPAEQRPTISELRKKLLGDSQKSNLEYVETALELRRALIEKGEPDPFLPIGDKVEITDAIISDAEKVASLLEDCVEFAEGDSSVFTAKLQSKLQDSALPTRRRK
jgi:hypothetical protein